MIYNRGQVRKNGMANDAKCLNYSMANSTKYGGKCMFTFWNDFLRHWKYAVHSWVTCLLRRAERAATLIVLGRISDRYFEYNLIRIFAQYTYIYMISYSYWMQHLWHLVNMITSKAAIYRAKTIICTGFIASSSIYQRSFIQI